MRRRVTVISLRVPRCGWQRVGSYSSARLALPGAAPSGRRAPVPPPDIRLPQWNSDSGCECNTECQPESLRLPESLMHDIMMATAAGAFSESVLGSSES